MMPGLMAANAVIDQAIVKQPFGVNRYNLIFRTGFLYLIPACVLIVIAHSSYPRISWEDTALLISMGAFWTLALLPYFKGLQESNAGVVTALFNTIPLMTFGIAWIFLGEHINLRQAGAAVLILFAATAIGFNPKTIRFNYVAMAYIVTACLMYSVYVVLLRYVAHKFSAPAIVGWIMMGAFLTTLAIISCAPQRRVQFLEACKTSPKMLLALFFIQLIIGTFTHLVTIKSLQVGPGAGIVNTIWNLQPAFAFFYLILAGRLLPAFYRRICLDRAFVWHLSCLILMFVGLLLLLHS
ncbi:MAG: DMT family transporter [Alphaproteobacteria bacterium]|nr:DMT family transporter [Alphaproteobacteria bacterium]